MGQDENKRRLTATPSWMLHDWPMLQNRSTNDHRTFKWCDLKGCSGPSHTDGCRHN